MGISITPPAALPPAIKLSLSTGYVPEPFWHFRKDKWFLPPPATNKTSSYVQFVVWPLYRLSYPASLISVGCFISFSFHLLLRLSSALFHWAIPTKILYVFISHAYYTPRQYHSPGFNCRNVIRRRSQRPHGLRSATARLLRLWVRIPPEAWMSVCYECLCVVR